ncbi:MAG: PD-(D/E)XK nuclease family protein [Huintestinicola sp.]
MGLKLYYGNPGTGKSYAMMDDIRTKAAEGGKVCVIVPDQFTFEYERMLYSHLGCRLFNKGNTEVLSFTRLAERIAACSAERFPSKRKGNPPPADGTVKNAVMYLALKSIAENEGFLFFGRQAKKPSFVRTALSMLSELICGGVTEDVMAELAGKAPENFRDKLSDISLIYTKYTSVMAEKGYRDSLLNLLSLSDAASEAEISGFFDGMYVYLDEFKSFTGDQFGLINAMLPRCAQVTVCMTTDDPAASGNTPFASVAETCGKLYCAAEKYHVPFEKREFTENKRFKAPELEHAAKNLFRSRPHKFEGSADSITYVKAADLYAECEYVCAEIRRLVCEEKTGLHYSDIAVLSRSMGDCISVLESAFDRYEIPFYSDRKPPASYKPLMLFITSALELAAAKDISTEAMLRYLKTGLSGISGDDISKLENYCYSWDIDGKMWDESFPDDDIEAIRLAAVAPPQKLAEVCGGGKPVTGSVICEGIREFIGSTHAEEILLSDIEGSRISDAEAADAVREHERLANDLDKLLSDLESVLGSETLTLDRFGEIFMLSAQDITLASPPLSLDAVYAAQSDLARLSSPKVVFVLSAADGILPCTDVDKSAFTDNEREFFVREHFELSGGTRSRLAEEKFVAYKVLTSPSERLYISRPCFDTAGKPLYPSAVIERMCGYIPGIKKTDASELGTVFFSTTERSAYTALIESGRKGDPQWEAVKKCLSENDFYSRRFAYLDSLKSGEGHCVNDKQLMEKLFGKSMKISASRFEDHSSCPFMFFCKSGLKLYPLQKNTLNAANLGNVMHAVLCGLMRSHTKSEFLSMDEKALREQITALSGSYVKENMKDNFGKKKSFYFYLDIMTETLLIALMHIQRELNASEFIPSAFELPIGYSEDGAPILIDIDGEHSLRFIGTADRVDEYTAPDGERYIRILDYKTGIKDFDLTQLPFGINMQMFFYLFALTDSENGGKYTGCRPAGALYAPIKYPHLDKNREDAPPPELTADKELKLKGIVLGTKDIAGAMEKDICGNYIPVKLKKDGTFDSRSMSHLVTENMLSRINDYSKQLLKKLGESIYSGEVPASPLQTKSCRLSCGFCDYREICGNYPETKVRDVSDIDENMFISDNDNTGKEQEENG